MNKKYVLLAVVFLLYILINSQLLFNSPPVWPDESGYADGALNLLHENRLFSSLWGDIGHYHKGIFWYPPFMFYMFSFMFKIFGFSIETMRYTTFFAGGIFLILLYFFSKEFFKKDSLLAFLPIFFVLIDQAILDKTRIARPEIYILICILSSALLVMGTKKLWRFALAGFFAGLAFLIYFAGAIAIGIIGLYIIYKGKFSKDTLLRLSVFAVPIGLCILWWLSVIQFDIKTLVEGLAQQRGRKSGPLFLTQLFNGAYFISALRDTTIFFGSIFLSIYLFLHKKFDYRVFLILTLIISWLYILFTKGDMVYPAPFFYIAVSLFLMKTYQEADEKPFYFIGGIILSLLLSGLAIKEMIPKFANRPSYHSFVTAVAKEIPDNSSVFISTLPNVYFELRKNDTLTLRLFLEANGYKKEYLDELDKMDYVVINHDLSQDIYGNLVSRYVQANSEEVKPVQVEQKGYGAYVVKLKPLTDRIAIE